MKTYKGECLDKTAEHRVMVWTERSIKPLRHVSYHSPSGFGWGYRGSGPADLALSILANYFAESYVNRAYIFKMKVGQVPPQCISYHQSFKEQFIAPIVDETWQITSEQIDEWVAKQKITSIKED